MTNRTNEENPYEPFSDGWIEWEQQQPQFEPQTIQLTREEQVAEDWQNFAKWFLPLTEEALSDAREGRGLSAFIAEDVFRAMTQQDYNECVDFADNLAHSIVEPEFVDECFPSFGLSIAFNQKTPISEREWLDERMVAFYDRW